MAWPLTELPVIRIQRPLQDLLRLLVGNAHRHEVIEVIEAPFAGPRVLVHGFPNDPRYIRELIELGKLAGWHGWIAIRSRIPGRFAVETNHDTVIRIDDEGVGGARDSVPMLVYAVPLVVDVARVGPVILVSDTD
jgi:hypothetical protein